jgi:hypothetical protein
LGATALLGRRVSYFAAALEVQASRQVPCDALSRAGHGFAGVTVSCEPTGLTAHVSQSREMRGAQQRTLPMRLKHYIDQRLCDPCIGPAQVTAEFGISTRYLHKLF